MGWYRDESLKSAYLYQLYTYVRTQEKADDLLSMNSTGVLLHPTTDEPYDEAVQIDGHCFRFMTVNLAGKVIDMKRDLLKVVEEYTWE